LRRERRKDRRGREGVHEREIREGNVGALFPDFPLN
jgi:hypothetical protein